MTAIDTNLIVRVVTNDDPAQTRRARALLASGPVWVPKTVLLETEWVLRSAYDLSPTAIARALRTFLGLPNVTVEDAETARRALDTYSAGMDFAAALHLASASHAAARFATFDRALRLRAAKTHGLLPVMEP